MLLLLTAASLIKSAQLSEVLFLTQVLKYVKAALCHRVVLPVATQLQEVLLEPSILQDRQAQAIFS